jgi:hypothetical protein
MFAIGGKTIKPVNLSKYGVIKAKKSGSLVKRPTLFLFFFVEA